MSLDLYDLTIGLGSAVPGRRKNAWAKTVAPTSGDDADDGYEHGSLWLDTTNHRLYICEVSTVAAAVWLDLTDSIPPSAFGAAGDILVGTGVGTYAARKNNDGATTAPTASDDNTAGYAIGSRWLDTTNSKEWVALSVGTGTASWLDLTAGGGGGAPTTVDYLVGTADAGLSAEIVVGTTPGGELAGGGSTWASPVIASSHSGSAHHAQTHVLDGADHTVSGLTIGHTLQALTATTFGFAAAPSGTPASTVTDETTFGISTAVGTDTEYARQDHTHGSPTNPVTAHEGAGDPHTGYRLESADHSHATTGLQGGTIAHSVTTGQTVDDHHNEAHVINSTGPHAESGLTTGHVLRASGAAAFSFAALIAGDIPALAYAPDDVDFLVGTASGSLSAEIVVGTAPGGELGGTWASPTVGATHSGSAHHTKYTDGEAVSAMGVLGDANALNHDRYTDAEAIAAVDLSGYWLSATALGGELGGTLAAATVDATHSGSAHHNQSHVLDGGDHTVSGLTIGHVLQALTATTFGFAAAPTGTPASTVESETSWGIAAAVGTDTEYARQDHTHGSPTDPTYAPDWGETVDLVAVAFGDTADAGVLAEHSRADHRHPAMVNPVTAHVAAGDPHTGYRLESADHTHATTGLQGGTIAHSDTTGKGTDDHHAEVHTMASTGPHAQSGLTAGHFLRASGAAAFDFAAIADADVPSTHSGSAHHTKYTDGEAVTAMGVLGDSNALNHDRYTDAEAIAAVDLSGYWLSATTLGGELGGTLAAATVDATHSGSAHHNQSHVLDGGDHTVSGLTTGHVLQALSATTFGFAAATSGTPATTVTDETTFGISTAVGTDTEYARQDHTHGSPVDPVTAHVAAGDPHTGYFLADGSRDLTGDLTHTVVSDTLFPLYEAQRADAGPGAVDDNDVLWRLVASGYDGTGYISGGGLEVRIDGTPGTNDMPTELVFSTNTGGATATEQWRIAPNGDIEPLVSYLQLGTEDDPVGYMASEQISMVGDGWGASLEFYRKGGANVDNDYIGFVSFYGDDGSGFAQGPVIYARIDGTVAANDMATELVFGNNLGAYLSTDIWRFAPTGAFEPMTDSAYDIGTASIRPATIYADNLDSAGDITIGAQTITAANWLDLTDGGATTLHSHAAGGAPSDADYLVGTANGTLSAEIVVGTTPNGELGGTWGAITVDATHSGTAHSNVPTQTGDLDMDGNSIISSSGFPALGESGIDVGHSWGVYAGYIGMHYGHAAPAVGPYMDAYRYGAAGAVAPTDAVLWQLETYGNDGTSNLDLASIFMRVDGAVATGDMPTDIVFATGDNGWTERWRIASTGNFEPIADSSYDIGTDALRVASTFTDTLRATNIGTWADPVTSINSGDWIGLMSRSDTAVNNIEFYRSRAGTTIVQDDDWLGYIGWYANDGAEGGVGGAFIAASVDGTPADDDVPTELLFATTNAGTWPTERWRIAPTGHFEPYVTGTYDIGTHAVSGTGLHVNAIYVDHIYATDIGKDAINGQLTSITVGTVQTSASGTLGLVSSSNINMSPAGGGVLATLGATQLDLDVDIDMQGNNIISDGVVAGALGEWGIDTGHSWAVYANYFSMQGEWAAAGVSPYIDVYRYGAAGGAIPTDGYVWEIEFYANDGTDDWDVAAIDVRVDGAVSTGVMPTDIIFSTTETVGWTERWRVASNGDFEPMADGVYDIGTATNKAGIVWADLVYAQTLDVYDPSTFGQFDIGRLPAATSGDTLAYMYFRGTHNGTTANIGASIYARATETWGASARGTSLSFQTTPNLGTSQFTRWRIEEDGDFYPFTDSLYDIGRTSNRVNNIYTDGLNTGGNIVPETAGGPSIGAWTNEFNTFYSNYHELTVRDDAGVPQMKMNRTRTSSAIVQDGDELGRILFTGRDTTTQQSGASISAVVDGTPGATDMPAELLFATTPNGSTTPATRLAIRETGDIELQGNTLSGPADPAAGDEVGDRDYNDARYVALDALYPVGAIYMSTNSSLPTALSSLGTWAAMAAGRVLIGHQTGTYAGGNTGGSETQATHTHTADTHTHTPGSHTHSEDYVPNHSHTITANHVHGERVRNATAGSSTVPQRVAGYSTGSLGTVIDTDGGHTTSTTSSGGSGSSSTGTPSASNTGGISGASATGADGDDSIVQPWLSVYMWERTA